MGGGVQFLSGKGQLRNIDVSFIGLQSYFNNHIEGPSPSNGVHGPINTNSELKSYDPGLYQLIKELYPCGNTYHWCKGNYKTDFYV